MSGVVIIYGLLAEATTQRGAAAAPSDKVVLFGPEHLWAAAWTLAGILVLTLLVRWSNCEGRLAVCKAVLIFLGAVTLAAMIGTYVVQAWEHQYTIEHSLPLHLCNVAVLLTMIATWFAARHLVGKPRLEAMTLTQRLYEVLYFWGLGFTMQAVLTPDLPHHFPHPEFITFFVAHGGIIAAVIVLTFGLRMRPMPGAVLRVWAVTTVLMLLVLALDFAIGGEANYMYLRWPAPHSLMERMGDWPWYLFTLQAVGVIGYLVLYAPWWFADRRRKKSRGVAAAG